MVDFKKVLKSAEKGVLNLLDILKEDPIYGGRLRNLKSKEMGYERRKFHLIIELGRKTYWLYYQNKITDPGLLYLCKKLRAIDNQSKIYHGTERRVKKRD
ncbi:MAG: hypothetical protein COS68_04960 [Elusimicrobia bacterium CG06_land_8_20_14_3_00_38_11]|nr:MAG: hypothetical protein COS68_04960 [Elusimicrobia bacterium CG06_land_8_20_14_3_00_38_11]